MLHIEFASWEVYTQSNETLGRKEEEGIVEGMTVRAEGGKAEGGGDETLVVATPTLSSSTKEKGVETGTATGTTNEANITGTIEGGARTI